MAKTKAESIIIYRPDGVAVSYKLGTEGMNFPGENMHGNVSEITMADAEDGNDFCRIEFVDGAAKTFSGMPYVHYKG